MSVTAQDEKSQSGNDIKENKSLIAYLADKPLEQVGSLLVSIQFAAGGVASFLEEEGVQPIEKEGKSIDLKTWFNDNEPALVVLHEAVEKLTQAARNLSQSDADIVERVVEMQAGHEAYYGMATMAALRDAYREAGIGDNDKSDSAAPATAYALQGVYDAMPEELKTQTRDYLAQKFSM